MLRPTRAGWLFFVIIFGVGFAALNTGNNLLYLVLALMLSFLVLSGLLSESALRGSAPTDEVIAAAAAAASADCDPTTDQRGPAVYKRHLAGELTARAIRRAVARAKGGE